MEFTTIQHMIRMNKMFQGWVMKRWDNVNKEQSNEMRKVNKIIVKTSVLFYSKAWTHRNEMLYNPEKYKEYVVKWHNNII